MTTGTPLPLTTDTLRWLRLHGFALTFYGGKALHAGVGAPTDGQSWRTALDGISASLTDDGMPAKDAHDVIAAIGSCLFDLNAVEPVSAGVAVAASISKGTSKV